MPGTVPQGYIQPGDYSTNTASNSKVAVGLNGFANSTDYLNTGRINGNYGDGIPDELRKDIPGLIERGKQRFTINCAVCHGATATGNGIVTQYGLVGVANLQQQSFRDMPDGQIFKPDHTTARARWALMDRTSPSKTGGRSSAISAPCSARRTRRSPTSRPTSKIISTSKTPAKQ